MVNRLDYTEVIDSKLKENYVQNIDIWIYEIMKNETRAREMFGLQDNKEARMDKTQEEQKKITGIHYSKSFHLSPFHL